MQQVDVSEVAFFGIKHNGSAFGSQRNRESFRVRHANLTTINQVKDEGKKRACLVRVANGPQCHPWPLFLMLGFGLPLYA